MSWSVSIFDHKGRARKSVQHWIIRSATAWTYALVLSVAALGVAHAKPVSRQTNVTFSTPVGLPDQVVKAGSYRFLLISPDVVQVTTDGGGLIGTYMAISADRSNPAAAEVVLQERAGRSEKAVIEWFFEGDSLGVSLVYP
jgi:hypothetical protein